MGYYVQLQGYCNFSSEINKYRVERPITSIEKDKVFSLKEEKHSKFMLTQMFKQSIISSSNALIIPLPKMSRVV